MKICFFAASVALTVSLAPSLSAQRLFHAHVDSLAGLNGEGEIVSFDAASGRFFVTNPAARTLDVYEYAAGALARVQSISLGGEPNGCAVHSGLVAVAIEGSTKQDLGSVEFYAAATGFTSGARVVVGALPDMLAFTPDGSKLVVANEGEADVATGLNNPEGSVSIIDVAARTVQTADFNAFDSQKAALQAAGVRVQDTNGITLSQDMEPEYVAVSADGATAYVSCQENNALAIVDIASATVNDILPLGEKDHSLPGNEFDASNLDGVAGNFQNWPVRGYYMPDGICTFTVNGVEYIASANEGHCRSVLPGFIDETRGHDMEASFVLDSEDPTPETGSFTSAQLNDDALLGSLNMATSPYDVARGDTDGDGDIDQLYAFGGRSMTIWDTAGNVVFDSGDALERAMLDRGLLQDSRSDDQGPEPESVVFGVVGNLPYLFVGLERTSAICAFNVADPQNPVLEDVIDIAGESGVPAYSPDGLAFIPRASSPLGLDTLAVISDQGGVLSLFSLNAATKALYGMGCDVDGTGSFLELDSDLPVLGSNWRLTINNAGNVSLVAFLFGDTVVNPGTSLAMYGAPLCRRYSNANLALGLTLPGFTVSYVMPVPNTPSLAGCQFAVQGLVGSTQNVMRAATSNGLLAVIGF